MTESKNELIYKSLYNQCLILTMKEGDELKAHRASVDVLIIIKDGIAEIAGVDDKKILKTGEHIFFKAGALHAVKAINRLQFYLIKLALHD